MIGVTLRYKWIIWAMFVGLGLEPVLPSGRHHASLPPTLYRMVSEMGGSFSLNNASGGLIEAFWISIHAFCRQTLAAA